MGHRRASSSFCFRSSSLTTLKNSVLVMMEKNAILRHILVLEQPGSLLPAQGTVIFLLNHVGSGGLSGDLFLPTQTTQSCKPVEILISL